MYTIYANDILIHSPDMVDDNLILVSTVFEEEINKTGSCEFDIYNDHPYYNAIQTLKTIITIKDNDEEVWRGRVLNIERNFDNVKHVYCEGVLSFMLDSIARPFKHTKTMPEQFTYLVSVHNAQVEDFKQFTIGQITVDDLYGSKEWENTEYPQIKDEIDNIVNEYGGYLVTSYVNGQNVISYIKDPSHTSNQVIEFGENLLDFTETIDSSNIFTVLIPIGYDANNNKITIESVNEGKDYIENEDGIQRYGKIIQQYTFPDDISSPSELLQKGTNFLASSLQSSKTISISALDLHTLNPSVNKIKVYDLIQVKSEPHGLNEYEICSRVSIDIDNPDSNEYTIGTVPEGLTEQSSKMQKEIIYAEGSGSDLPDGDIIQY